ncbi:MAG: 2-oxoglutarate and iron-dependent oxygenase domain-containing protein [Minwuia sp.]|nr:2-oxoglutarate and iron-dependent oxygenase domain-containing protein [Minwuia sp.]
MIRLTQTTMDEDIVPVIDFAPFREGGEIARRRTADEIDRACRSIGFLVIGGHGIPQELIDRAFAISRTFFAQSTETKMQAAPPDKTIPRGYQAFASKRLAATLGIDTPPDLREQFFMGPPEDHSDLVAAYPDAERFYATNIWPDAPDGFRETMTELYRAFERLGSDLMTAFALGLGLPEDYFTSRIDRHFSTGTTNLYPALQTAPEEGQLRTGMHTDFGSLTLLLRSETVGGLQVQGDDGDWHDVPDIPGTLVVNIGDMMARWTNDQWRSTLHRVANPPTVDGTQPARQSMAYFLHPNYDSMVEALPGCVTANQPAAYPPIMAGEHMREKLVKRVV